MSYNISAFKVKTLRDFSFPVASLYGSNVDWHPYRIDSIEKEECTTEFVSMESSIKGTIDTNGYFHVNYIDCSGEGSGATMHFVFEPAFKKSKGTLVAVCVWEGGDTIEQLDVNDGNIKLTEIEI